MKIRILSALAATAVLFAALAGCAPDSGDYYNITIGPSTDAPAILVTISPLPSETEGSAATDTIPPEEVIFDEHCAEELMPVLAALMESNMLNKGQKRDFPPASISDAVAVDFLYAYAQANTYVAQVGATLSDFEIKELLDIAFGGSYSYDNFISAVNAGGTNITRADNAWSFGVGETYAPGLTFSGGTSGPFDASVPYSYSYTDAFDDSISGSISVYLQPSRNNVLGFTITAIKLAGAQ